MRQRILGLVIIDVLIAGVVAFFAFRYSDQFEAWVDKYPFVIVIFCLLFAAPSYIFIRIMKNKSTVQKQYLDKNGMSGTAVITGIQDTGSTTNSNPVLRLDLKVTPAYGAEFERSVEVIASRLELPRLQQTLQVRYDPNNVANLMVVADGKTILQMY